jgi:hypothetical protein
MPKRIYAGYLLGPGGLFPRPVVAERILLLSVQLGDALLRKCE